jgi:hypothetical protein
MNNNLASQEVLLDGGLTVEQAHTVLRRLIQSYPFKRSTVLRSLSNANVLIEAAKEFGFVTELRVHTKGYEVFYFPQTNPFLSMVL